jgi:hypothetical protein
MTDKTNSASPIAGASADADAQRRAWSAPCITRLRAGEAELGANPAKTEQAFAYGS